jgi:FkbM family methyltransferase
MIPEIANFIDKISRSENNYLIAKSRKLFSAILCHDAIGQVISTIYQDKIPQGDFIFNTKCDVVKPSTKARLFWGVYETPEIDFIKKHLRPDLDVIELGSSLGVVASHIGKMLNPSSRLICVEANPLLLDCLAENLKKNIGDKNPILIHAAINYLDEQKSIEFSVSSDSLVSQIGHHAHALRVFQVPVITLSEIVAKYKINQYALVCDIEGAEKGLIDNEERTLNHCQQLHIEIQDTVINNQIVRVKEMVEILSKKHGFQIVDRYLGAYVFERTHH